MGEKPSDGQGSVYFDATENHHLMDESPHPAVCVSDAIGEEPSPWATVDNASPPPATAGVSTILPAAAHGYLAFGVRSVGTPSLPLSETETTTVQDDESIAAGGIDSSYMGHLRAQSTLPKKWLNEVDIEPYMKLPGGSSNRSGRGRKESLFAAGPRRSYLREPLLEELLPTSRKESLFPAIHGKVLFRDQIAAYVYWAMLAVMVLIGIGLCFVSPPELRDRIIRSTSLLRAIVDSSWIMLVVLVFGCAISSLWLALMGWFANEVVHLMVIFAPTTSLLVGVWALVEFLHADPGGGFWLLCGAVSGFTGAALFTTFIMANRGSIKYTVDIVKMTAEVLTLNPGIYIISMLLLAVYVLFTALWMLFYVHILMLGHVESLPADSLAKVWKLSAWSYYLQAYFIFMLVWTSIIISYVQKCMIGGVVGRWYFFRTEPEEASRQGLSTSWDALNAACTTFFGQICLASLVLSPVRLTRAIIHFYHYIAAKTEGGLFASMLKSIDMFLGFVERIFEHVTDLAIYFVALTGEGFWDSGRAVLKIFRRNMLIGFTTDTIALSVFAISTTVVAAVTGLGSYMFVSHVLESKFGFMTVMLFSLLTWYILRFFTSIFSDTLDAAFVCFAIDLDTEKLHSPTVHQAFSHRIAAGRGL